MKDQVFAPPEKRIRFYSCSAFVVSEYIYQMTGQEDCLVTLKTLPKKNLRVA